jgi:nitroimidazol reductase NimA-like FMN-containing flavoprotein (pyridoxamine 5'-phosphate oxidase superfamily)
MDMKAVEILDRNRLMAIATVRPDGWPQATMVGYANEGLLIYFVISRRSQKFANIARDDRVSLVIGRDFHDAREIEGLSVAAHASEVTDPAQRERAYKLLIERRPEYGAFPKPDPAAAAVMRARCSIITVLDYSRGFGHADVATVGAGAITEMKAARPDDWGLSPSADRNPRT